MIDFHSHILPNMDDGAGSVAESLAMLRESFLQGVDLVISTSHFYADQEYPQEFLRRRAAAFQSLRTAMLLSPEVYPNVMLGAEVRYFPGIGESTEILSLRIGDSRCILVEPPMIPWSDDMLEDIARIRTNFDCIPVIAHVDRFQYYLKDPTLMERIRQRDMVVQVNAESFLNPKTLRPAVKHLKNGQSQLIGSDCHNMTARLPNLGLVKKQARTLGVEAEFQKLHENAVNLLLGRGEL